MQSFFSEWEVTTYKLVTDSERGDIPFLSDTFNIPNVRNKTQSKVLSGSVGIDPTAVILNFDVVSSQCTNMPEESILGDSVVSTEKGVLNWFESDEYYYPAEKIEDFETGASDSGSSGKAFIQIIPYGKLDSEESAIEISGVSYYSSEGALFGINTICAYKTVEITPSTTLYFKAIDSTNENYEAVIKELSGSSSSLPNRSKWYVGNQVTDEENTFNIVTTLCKQGFIAGFTDRNGAVILRDYIGATSNISTHDNDIIIGNSLKGFGLSNISKCYNEFTVKFHSVDNDFKKELGVYFVDADAFPENDDKYQPNKNNSGSVTIRRTGAELDCFPFPSAVWDDLPEVGDLMRIVTDDYFVEGTYLELDGISRVFSITSTDIDEELYIINMDLIEYYNEENTPLWQTYVVGINSYSDAKDLWTLAHQSWLINKRIRKAPKDRTELKWAVDLDTFYNTDSYDETIEYAQSYFKLLVEWTTRQKLQVSYDLPITTDTVKLNIVDNVLFNDAIILPNPAEYGDGWITSISVDPNKDVVKCGITFEPSFFAPPMPIITGNIIETGSRANDIVETGSRVNNIIEGN
jgi:hypothetical protein